MEKYENIGVIKNEATFDSGLLIEFEQTIEELKQDKSWTKEMIAQLFYNMIPEFGYKNMGKYLDSKM